MDDNQQIALKNATPVLAMATKAYENRLSEFGPEARAVFWLNHDMQQKRYQILVDIFDDIDQAGGISIHDFGCGYGALFEYLKDHPVMQKSRYIGTDMSQKMIEAAQFGIQDPRAHFVRHLKATETVDYTFISGTYNMHMGTDDNQWTDYVKASLSGLWRTSRKGLVFNMLHHDTPDKFLGLYYADPKLFFDFCSQHLSGNVRLSIDKPLPDWTIFIRRE